MRKLIKKDKKRCVHFLISTAAILLWLVSLGGCTSAKKLVYFQKATSNEDTIAMPEQFISTIKKGDVLSIQVSSLNPEASAYFNPAAASDGNSVISPTNPLARTSGYLVDPEGRIELPLIGQLTILNLTNAKAAELIRDKLKTYLKEPTVNVRNLNFRISVLGEVSRPSLFTIPNEQITLPEALGLAGDLTIYGRRDNVLIVREVGDKHVFARLDLTRRDAFRSVYYSLHPNDVVYIEPGKVRATSVDRGYLLAPIITGILSIIAIIATRR